MREIVFDTETTGIEPSEGHRVVEIGAVELWNHLPTGRTWHQYINPERPMPKEAFEIHGISDEMLRDKPVFARVAQDFLAFIGGDAALIAHNASFDFKFLNAELFAAGLPPLDSRRMVDTIQIARARFPGAPASLDALCRRFGVDNSGREKHGALLDSELLAEVYLELIGGRQPDFGLAAAEAANPARPNATAAPRRPVRPRAAPLPPRLTEAEEAAHRAFVEKMGPAALWAQVGAAD